ncbi:MAG: hypothetical protein Q9207_003689 [Kuettlingeria erythrocarpa]
MQRGRGRGGGRGAGQGAGQAGRGGGSRPAPGLSYQTPNCVESRTPASQPSYNQPCGTTPQPSIQRPDEADQSVGIPDGIRRWPPPKILSGACPSPLDDLEPTAATTIADHFYNQGSQAENVWGPPVDTSQLDITQMKTIEKKMVDEELRLRAVKDTTMKGKLAVLKRELVKDKLHDKQRQEYRRLYDKELINNAWCFHEHPLWLQGVPEDQPWDPDWDVRPSNRISRAPEGRLIRIPYNSDIPRIPDIPADAISQMTAWIIIMRYLYPDATPKDVTAVLNRIWYGPMITYYMTVRARIEGPPNQKQLEVQQMPGMVQSQKLFDQGQASEWMAKLQANEKFVCTFPNPTIPGGRYEWCAGFECVVKKINDAAERVDIDSLKGVSKIPDEFWDVKNQHWI